MATPSAPIQAAQNSPRNRQRSPVHGVSSPPPENIMLSSSSSSSDSFQTSLPEEFSGTENAGASKKPVWNKPSNGATEGGVVMGADSWPALSDSARASPKSSTDSLKSLAHGSADISMSSLSGMAIGSLPLQKDISASSTSPTTTHVTPTRQKSIKRAEVETPLPDPVKSGASVGEFSKDKDASQRGGSYTGNEQQQHQQRSSFRRNNRGDGSYPHSHGGRRDKQEWVHPQRSFGGRDNHAGQPRVGSRTFIRGPAPNPTFIPPTPHPVPVRPYLSPIVYPDMQSPVYFVHGAPPDSIRPMSMVPLAPMFVPMPDPMLPSKIVNQIDYYFSNENLVKDTFLRQNMDVEGWVPIKLIAGFKKVMQLTDNIQLILYAIQASNIVEVQGDKVRRKSDWGKWVIPPVQYSPLTSPQSLQKSGQDMLAAHLSSVTLNEKTAP